MTWTGNAPYCGMGEEVLWVSFVCFCLFVSVCVCLFLFPPILVLSWLPRLLIELFVSGIVVDMNCSLLAYLLDQFNVWLLLIVYTLWFFGCPFMWFCCFFVVYFACWALLYVKCNLFIVSLNPLLWLFIFFLLLFLIPRRTSIKIHNRTSSSSSPSSDSPVRTC
jgi:hypothetical protein